MAMDTKILFLTVMLFGATAVMAANAKITGTLKDAADKTPIIGATVVLLEQETKIQEQKQNSENADGHQEFRQVAATTTDAGGKFALEAPTGDFVLEITYVGYETLRMSLRTSGNTGLGDIEMSESATELGEVVVEGQGTIQKVDRQVLLPSKEQLQAASDGISLLQNMQIPRIVVNPIDNTIKTLSNEGVQLRINGIEATQMEVNAINPKDVIRIEYHDQPGVRYNGAAAVIDYIVRHRDTGGSFMLNASNGVTITGWGEYYAAGKLHFGKSSLNIMGMYSPRDVKWTRNNDETYNFSSDTVHNSEIGEPTRYRRHPINLGLAYNWTNDDKDVINIILRDNIDIMPNARTDRDSKLFQPTDSFTIHDHESNRIQSPALDIYYQHNFPHNQSLYADVVGTYIYSRTDRRFIQEPLTGSTVTDTTDVSSSVKGSKWSIIGEIIYEKRWEKSTLTLGLKHSREWIDNTYMGSVEQTVGMRTVETYGFAEFRQNIGNFSYAAGIGVMNTNIKQGNTQSNSLIARPQLTMSYDFGKGWFWKYHAYISSYEPSLSAMSDVAQQIDKYQVRVGNPNLKPVMYFSNDMQLSRQGKHVNLNIYACYSYDHKPIMEESYERQGMIVRSYDNQQGFHRLQVSSSVQVRLLQNKLIFTVTPFANYYVGVGNNYRHRYFNPGICASVMGMVKNWQFFGDVTTRRNNLWGETLEFGEFIHTIGVGYNADKWGFRVMMMEPFSTRGYRSETENLSAVAPNRQKAAIKNFNQVVMLNFHCNLDFGTKRGDSSKRINNEDTDNGILSGAK